MMLHHIEFCRSFFYRKFVGKSLSMIVSSYRQMVAQGGRNSRPQTQQEAVSLFLAGLDGSPI